MATWIFEPGHTEAEFRARHMMVTWVRGLFKDIHGQLELDWERCLEASFEGEIDATGIWTGEPARDAHLRSADFFDVENHPRMSFAGRFTERTASTTFKGQVDLTIRGVTHAVPLDIAYLGEWRTPFWEGDENQGDIRRIGFEATARIDRRDFGVPNSPLEYVRRTRITPASKSTSSQRSASSSPRRRPVIAAVK